MGRSQHEAQCSINLSLSPLLKHYPSAFPQRRITTGGGAVGALVRGWTAARSFRVGQIVESVQPLREPRGQTVRWHGLG